MSNSVNSMIAPKSANMNLGYNQHKAEGVQICTPSPDAEEALTLLACAWRVNRKNVADFEQRLDQLADIGRDLRNGRCTATEGLDRAEALGFVAPVSGEEVRHA